MNKRITKKVNQRFYLGCLNASIANHSAKDLTDRIWLIIKMCKKLHWIKKDNYYADTKMQAFAMNIWNKHTTKRDVYKYVKALKGYFKVNYIIYKPTNGNIKCPKTWNIVKMKNKNIRFDRRWFRQLNWGMEFLLHWIGLFITVKYFKQFLDRVMTNIKKARARQLSGK